METYDLFVSYCRRDNTTGRITELVKSIGSDFEKFAGRPLRLFFDGDEIQGMDDWQDRILIGLRQSHVLLVFLSSNYIKSPYCEWEFQEYWNHEIARCTSGSGIASIYFADAPELLNNDFEQKSSEWIEELNRRNRFDFRSWVAEGEEALKTVEVKGKINALSAQIHGVIRCGELANKAKGNLDRYNEDFSGRAVEMRLVHEAVMLGRVGTITVLHGIRGIGKTALAQAYAHAFAFEYPAGRWQINCGGQQDLQQTIISLMGQRDLDFEFTDDEKRDIDLGFERVLQELKKRAEVTEPGRVLLIFDNVDQAELFALEHLNRLPAEDWLHIIATTRLAPSDFGNKLRSIVVGPLSEDDAVSVIEKRQPDGQFRSKSDRKTARDLFQIYDGFTLAIELAAAHLGSYPDVDFKEFSQRMRSSIRASISLESPDDIITPEGGYHFGELIDATLDRCSRKEICVVTYAALLPSDYVVLPWLRDLAAQDFPELGLTAEPGRPNPWHELIASLNGLGVFQINNQDVRLVRMNRLVQDNSITRLDMDDQGEYENRLAQYIKGRSQYCREKWNVQEARWELDPLAALAMLWMDGFWRVSQGAVLGHEVASIQLKLARYAKAEPLLRRSFDVLVDNLGLDHPSIATILNNLDQVFKNTNRELEAEPLFQRVLTIQVDTYGVDDPEVAATMFTIGSLLLGIGQKTKAEYYFCKSLSILEKTVVPGHYDVATRLSNLARVLAETDRTDEAQNLYNRVISILEKTVGIDHLNIKSHCQLSKFLVRDGSE